MDATKKPAAPEIVSIPYPNGAIYLEYGITGAFSGGWYRNYGETQGLYQWQGEMGYFYRPWFEGGIGFKMNAGEPSDSSQKVRNRFFLIGRFHKAWTRLGGYAGLQLGVDNLNVSLSSLDSGNFRKPFQETNAGLGVEFGLAWKFSRYAGITLGHRFEFSFVGEKDSSGNAVNFRIFPGLAFDLLPLLPSLRENVKAFYFFGELQFGRLILENVSNRRDMAWISGISLAF